MVFQQRLLVTSSTLVLGTAFTLTFLLGQSIFNNSENEKTYPSPSIRNYATLASDDDRLTKSKSQSNNDDPLVDPSLNVLRKPLEPCSFSPLTGYFRTGSCETGPLDDGRHTVCAVMTDSFLDFSKRMGNDLSTPRLEYSFPGLKDGDRWCVCALRWRQAFDAVCYLYCE
jgi:uncharacterized protein